MSMSAYPAILSVIFCLALDALWGRVVPGKYSGVATEQVETAEVVRAATTSARCYRVIRRSQ